MRKTVLLLTPGPNTADAGIAGTNSVEGEQINVLSTESIQKESVCLGDVEEQRLH